MRLTAFCIGVVFALGAPAAEPTAVSVGVVYAPAGPLSPAAVRQELERIRRAGYNAVVPASDDARRRVSPAAQEVGLGVIPLRPKPGGSHARILVEPGARGVSGARISFWEAIADGADDVAFQSPGGGLTPEVMALGETAGIVTRNQAVFAALSPRSKGVRSLSTGWQGPVEVKLLESADILVIIGVSGSPSPQRVTIQFERDVPEAIWQNLETGTSVSFVMAREGPFLEHTFAPRDSLVLMIRKKLRG